jgi:hypothetical protein
VDGFLTTAGAGGAHGAGGSARMAQFLAHLRDAGHATIANGPQPVLSKRHHDKEAGGHAALSDSGAVAGFQPLGVCHCVYSLTELVALNRSPPDK